MSAHSPARATRRADEPTASPSTWVGLDPDEPLHLAGDPCEVARQHVVDTALTPPTPPAPATGGRVGLELELHLVDLAQPARRPTWAEVLERQAAAPPLPGGSVITLEPGGQVELSGPPAADVVAAVEALRADVAVLRASCAEAGFGLAALGSDPGRVVDRVNPGARYDAMEAHFDALGCAGAGRQMMSATAALQVNLDAGPAKRWDERLALVAALVPVLVAASATSPYLGGHRSGWHSMRQGTWQGIDTTRSDPVPTGEPRAAWAYYALNAPVMLLRDPEAPDGMRAVTSRVPFAHWLRGDDPFGRAPTLADLDYHLTTLFPPVRPRGYVEVRCLDAMPDRWWPAMAAVVATLVDDAEAADRAAEITEPVAGAWHAAARDGLTDPTIRTAVAGCLDVAARHCPAALAAEVGELAELAAAGRTPGDELRLLADTHGPLRLLEEHAHA